MKLMNKLYVSALSGICLSSSSVLAKPAADVGYVRAETKLEAGSLDDLVPRAGFAKYLPKGSEFLVTLKGGNDLVEKLKVSDLGKYFLKLAVKNGMDEDEIFKDEDFLGFMAVAGEEVFFSTGEGSADFIALLGDATRQINTFTYKKIFKAALDQLDPEYERENRHRGMMDMSSFIPDYFTNPNGALKTLKKLEIAPMYAGFKVSDKEKREKMLKFLKDGLAKPVEDNFGKTFSAAESKVGNGFSGFSFSGQQFLDALKKEGAIEQMDQFLGKENAQEMRKEIAKQGFTVLVGSVDDYIVFFFGKSSDELVLVTDPSESILANPEMKFAANYATKEVAVIAYMSKAISVSLHSLDGDLAQLTEFLSDALKEVDYLGDLREIQDLLALIGKQELAILSERPDTRYGIVGYYEDGFKIDTYLGKSTLYADLNKTRTLAAMANHKDAVIYSSWVQNSGNTEKLFQLLDTLGEFAVKGARIVVEAESADEDFIEFGNYFKMVDAQFSDDLLAIWKALRVQASAGLGAEGAFMVDLKGTMPRIPNVPTVVLEGGKVPRIAFAQTVENRAKLGEAWKIIDVASRDIARGVSKLVGKDIELPKPEKASKAGLDIWSYQLGITSSEANLALGLNEKVFFLTSSPNYIAERVAALSKPASQPGYEFVIRFAPVRAAALEWIALLDKNGKDFMSERELKKYNKLKPDLKAFIKASEELEAIDIFASKVNGEVLSRLHIKTRK